MRRPFTTHAEQWNYGLEQTGIDRVGAGARRRLRSDRRRDSASSRRLEPRPTVRLRASFDYCIDGRPLRGAVYPPVTVLYRRAARTYEQDGHTQRVRVDGEVQPNSRPHPHDDRKPLSHWLASQARYMRLEADKLAARHRACGHRPAATADRRGARRGRLPALLIVRGGMFDGWAGLVSTPAARRRGD